MTEPDSNLRMRRFNATHSHRHRESSRSFIREKCGRCRDTYPLGVLQGGICSLCRVEIGLADFEERHEWEQRLKRDLSIHE